MIEIATRTSLFVLLLAGAACVGGSGSSPSTESGSGSSPSAAGGSGSSPSIGSGSATLCWNVPATNADGTPLADLAGYRLYWGRSPGGPYPNSAEIPDPATTRYVVDGLADGDWYFVTTAVNADGVESAYSRELKKTLVDGSPASCCCE